MVDRVFNYFQSETVGYVNRFFNNPRYDGLQHGIRIAKFVQNFCLLDSYRISRMVRDFWNVDVYKDALLHGTIQYYTRSQFENFRMGIITIQRVETMRKVNLEYYENQQGSEFLQDYVRIAGNQVQIDQIDQDEVRNARIMTNLFQQVCDFYGEINTTSLLVATAGKDIILRDSFFQDMTRFKDVVSIQTLIQHCGLSDSDYVKASFIAYVNYAMLSNRVEQDGTNYGEVFYQDFVLHTIKIAQLLQDLNRRQQHLRRNKFFRSDFMLQNQAQIMSESEIEYVNKIIQQRVGPLQDNLVICNKARFVIRPTYGRIFDAHRTDNNYYDILNNYQQGSIAQLFMRSMHSGLQNQQVMGLNEILQYTSGLYGGLIEIVSSCIVTKLEEYLGLTVVEDFRYVLVLIAVVFQIPFYLDEIPDTYGISNQIINVINTRTSQQIDRLVNDNDREGILKDIDDNQIQKNLGLSNYFTISFNKRYNSLDKLRLLAQGDQRELQILQEELRIDLLRGLNEILQKYLGDDYQQRTVLMALNAQNSIVRRVSVRPLIFYNNKQHFQLLIQKREALLKDVQERFPIDYFNLDNALNTGEVNRKRRRQEIDQPQQQPPQQQQVQQVQPQQIQQVEEEEEEIELDPRKFRELNKRKAIINVCDFNAERLLNDIDFNSNKNDCVRRIVRFVNKLYDADYQAANDVDLNNVLSQLQYKKNFSYISIEYDQNVFKNQLQDAMKKTNIQYVIYMSRNHIFIGTYKHLIQTIQQYPIKLLSQLIQKNNQKMVGQLNYCVQQFLLNQEKIEKRNNLKFFPVNQLNKVIENRFAIDKFTSSKALYYYDRIYARVFYDFETTFDDENQQYINKGFAQREGVQSYEQIDFAVSFVTEIKYNLNRVAQSIADELGLQLDATDMNFSLKEEMAYFSIPAAKNLFDRLYYYKKYLLQVQSKFLNFIQWCMIQRPDRKYQAFLQKFDRELKIEVFAYNGAKFDSHFILSHIKNKLGKQWYEYVEKTGTSSDFVILKYDIFYFMCLQRMWGMNMKLGKICKAFNIAEEASKQDIDMSKFKKLSIVRQHKDEIMKYVLNDSRAIFEIHKIFCRQVRSFISKFITQEQYFINYMNMQQSKKLDVFSIAELLPNFDKLTIEQQVYKLIKGQFAHWTTISQLSKNIFLRIFNQYFIQSSDNKEINEYIQSSYQGGYTQSFLLGPALPENELGKIFYLDENSMYPGIMKHALFPSNLNDTELLNYDYKFTQINRGCFNYDWDPLFLLDTQQFNMALNQSHYDLFEVQSFKFNDGVLTPLFGIRTKISGTIYPLEFNYENEKKYIIDKLVLFGFQIVQGFRLGILSHVTVNKRLRFKGYYPCVPLFKQFDTFMYELRQKVKDEEENEPLQNSLKIFINSLYGKFGEKIHDVNVVMEREHYDDELQMRQIIKEKLEALKDIQLPQDGDLFEQINIKVKHMYDLNNRDDGLIECSISDIPRTYTHFGTFTYVASLITAIGRTKIQSNIVRIQQNQNIGAQVYYADTDSIICNDKAFELYQKNSKQWNMDIDKKRIGAFKNEYPYKGDQNVSQLTQLHVFNKKIYQYWVWNPDTKSEERQSKFKGCKGVATNLIDYFTNNNGKYKQQQTRFVKRNGNVTIVDMSMIYKLRLGRDFLPEINNIQQMTKPFKSITQQQQIYGNLDRYVRYLNNQWQYEPAL